MLQAYSRLASLDAPRAAAVRGQALADAAKDPFSFERPPEFETAGFARALELLRQGEIEYAQREMAVLGVDRAGVAPAILWGVALLYARAGAPRLSHAVARGLLTDWLERWPSGDWRKAWELAFPRPYHPIVQREAKKNGVPEYLVYAVMREESAFEPTAVSPAAAFGLMQLIEPTARAYAKAVGLPSDPESLKKPAINVALGCRVLADLTKRFDQNPLLAIPGYNAGPGRPRQWVRARPGFEFDVWVELIPFHETRRYTKRVIASRAAYAFLYEKDENATGPMQLPLHVSD
jgi:soluble lytic murein transglycosylase